MADTFSRRHNVTPEASGIKCNREPRVLMWMCHTNLDLGDPCFAAGSRPPGPARADRYSPGRSKALSTV